ncbi:unnamed protein product [Brassica rapa subsp. narinosa]
MTQNVILLTDHFSPPHQGGGIGLQYRAQRGTETIVNNRELIIIFC